MSTLGEFSEGNTTNLLIKKEDQKRGIQGQKIYQWSFTL
jgi:hypothetical protein